MSRELDRIIRTHAGLLLVHVRGKYIESEPEFERYLNSLEISTEHRIRTVHLTSTGHQAWLQKFNVYGSPAILVFNNGFLILTIRGRISIESLNRLLEERVLV